MAGRVVVWGVDGFILPLAEHLAARGHLPNFARMMREGATTELLPYVSTWGPINWMSFVTGASPGSTWPGVWPVPSLSEARVAESGAYRCDTLWQALGRVGRSSLTVAYPACWPPLNADDTVIAPDTASTDLRPPILARPARIMTAGLTERYRQPPGTRAGWIPLTARGPRRAAPVLQRPKTPEAWPTLPVEDALETSWCVRSRAGESQPLYLLISPSQRCVWLFSDKAAAPLAVAREGEWSDWFPVRVGGRRGMTRVKLLELGDDGLELAICRAALVPQDQFAYPRELEDNLMAQLGPCSWGSANDLRPSDPFWEAGIEEARQQTDWMIDAAIACSSMREWSLFSTVFRAADTSNHGCMAFVDPELPFYGGDDTRAAFEILAAAYGVVDHALGRWMNLLDEDDVLVLASDHGAAVNHVTCDVYNLLVEEGLLALSEGDNGPVVDWANTQVYVRPTRSGSELFINLKGREPQGIVAAEHVEPLQRKLVDLLLDWREPETGGRAVALALTERDAALIGYWGPHAGDVQFIYSQGYVWGELPVGTTIARTSIPSVNHGPQIPTAARGLATNMGMMTLWGKGIRRGYRRDQANHGPAHMRDAAPTLALLLGCDPPRQCEGAVLTDMLE